MAAHHRLSQVESASTIVTMAYDPVGPRNSKNQRLDNPVHIGRRLRVLDNPCPSDDQHKMAFTFGNQQYTFTRCRFSYANSPAEFNIFLNKACSDARVRGNLVYVDDVLMKSVEDHLKEIDHDLIQLTTTGAKIALHKGQWFKTKVNYVGLLVGRNGIEPQSNHAQAIQSIKTPTNVSELRSFLGVCNYSQQFIENYADIARPLTSLLKKYEPFVWTKAQDTAKSPLKQCLCSAPCLAYTDPGK